MTQNFEFGVSAVQQSLRCYNLLWRWGEAEVLGGDVSSSMATTPFCNSFFHKYLKKVLSHMIKYCLNNSDFKCLFAKNGIIRKCVTKI